MKERQQHVLATFCTWRREKSTAKSNKTIQWKIRSMPKKKQKKKSHAVRTSETDRYTDKTAETQTRIDPTVREILQNKKQK